jgi:hypothetical protein
MFRFTLRWPRRGGESASVPIAEPADAPAAPARLGVTAHQLTATIGAALERSQDHSHAWITHLRSAIANLEARRADGEEVWKQIRGDERLAEMRRELAVHLAAHGEPT